MTDLWRVRTDPDELLQSWGRFNRTVERSPIAEVHRLSGMATPRSERVGVFWPVCIYVETCAGFWDCRPALIHRYALQEPASTFSAMGAAVRLAPSENGSPQWRQTQATNLEQALEWLGWSDLAPRSDAEICETKVAKFWAALASKCAAQPRVFEVVEADRRELTPGNKLEQLCLPNEIGIVGSLNEQMAALAWRMESALQRGKRAEAERLWRRWHELAWHLSGNLDGLRGARRRARDSAGRASDTRKAELARKGPLMWDDVPSSNKRDAKVAATESARPLSAAREVGERATPPSLAGEAGRGQKRGERQRRVGERDRAFAQKSTHSPPTHHEVPIA